MSIYLLTFFLNGYFAFTYRYETTISTKKASWLNLKMLMLPYSLILILACRAVHVAAIAPPHPNNTSWESIYARRRLLNITSDYLPSHVSSEYCRYLTEAQCRTDNEALAVAKEQRRLTATGSNLKVLVLLCRFKDHGNRQLPTRDYFDELFNGEGASDVNPVGSIREWMYSNSLGRYNGTF
jgi:hypothetical protein